MNKGNIKDVLIFFGVLALFAIGGTFTLMVVSGLNGLPLPPFIEALNN